MHTYWEIENRKIFSMIPLIHCRSLKKIVRVQEVHKMLMENVYCEKTVCGFQFFWPQNKLCQLYFPQTFWRALADTIFCQIAIDSLLARSDRVSAPPTALGSGLCSVRTLSWPGSSRFLLHCFPPVTLHHDCASCEPPLHLVKWTSVICPLLLLTCFISWKILSPTSFLPTESAEKMARQFLFQSLCLSGALVPETDQ